MKKTKKRKQKPKTFNKTTETINLPSFMQKSYLWNILWQTWWELQVPNETWNLWACVLAVNSAQVRERTTPTTEGERGEGRLKTPLPLPSSQGIPASWHCQQETNLADSVGTDGREMLPTFLRDFGSGLELALCPGDNTQPQEWEEWCSPSLSLQMWRCMGKTRRVFPRACSVSDTWISSSNTFDPIFTSFPAS